MYCYHCVSGFFILLLFFFFCHPHVVTAWLIIKASDLFAAPWFTVRIRSVYTTAVNCVLRCPPSQPLYRNDEIKEALWRAREGEINVLLNLNRCKQCQSLQLCSFFPLHLPSWELLMNIKCVCLVFCVCMCVCVSVEMTYCDDGAIIVLLELILQTKAIHQHFSISISPLNTQVGIPPT